MAKKNAPEIDAVELMKLFPKEISPTFFYNRESHELCVVSEPKPCDYQPVGNTLIFHYDPGVSKNCKDTPKADSYYSIWKNDLTEEEKADLQASDLNNLACVHLWWTNGPDWQLAKSLFNEAHQKDLKDKTIEANKQKIDNALNVPNIAKLLNVSLEAVKKLSVDDCKVEVLTSKEFKNLRLLE